MSRYHFSQVTSARLFPGGVAVNQTSPRLSGSSVASIFEKCLLQQGEKDADGVEVQGIAKARFHIGRLKENEGNITSLLAELPDDFRESGGGGMSFLNACMDRHGNQWTGLQQVMEQLFLLGMGIGKVSSLLPREAWGALPGGVPYYVVKVA